MKTIMTPVGGCIRHRQRMGTALKRSKPCVGSESVGAKSMFPPTPGSFSDQLQARPDQRRLRAQIGGRAASYLVWREGARQGKFGQRWTIAASSSARSGAAKRRLNVQASTATLFPRKSGCCSDVQVWIHWSRWRIYAPSHPVNVHLLSDAHYVNRTLCAVPPVAGST